MQLPPLGLGALMLYWRKGFVERAASVACALGIFLGGYFGSRAAIGLPPETLKGLFGAFLFVTAAFLWRRPATKESRPVVPEGLARLTLISVLACGVGLLSGPFGVASGILLVPLLVLVLGFEQRIAQGTSLVALVPPTGLLAFLNYANRARARWTGKWDC